MVIWYIHGAASTPLAFNWLKQNLHPHEFVDIEYDNKTPLSTTISKLRKLAAASPEPISIIGHSLGGIIAAAIAQTVPIQKIVTISTPFGGSFAASLMRWFMPSQLFRDVCQQSPILLNLKRYPPKVSILSFVTDSDFVVFGERTDGVVTVQSQTELSGPTYIVIKLNHFEVLLSQDVADQINNFLFNT